MSLGDEGPPGLLKSPTSRSSTVRAPLVRSIHRPRHEHRREGPDRTRESGRGRRDRVAWTRACKCPAATTSRVGRASARAVAVRLAANATTLTAVSVLAGPGLRAHRGAPGAAGELAVWAHARGPSGPRDLRRRARHRVVARGARQVVRRARRRAAGPGRRTVPRHPRCLPDRSQSPGRGASGSRRSSRGSCRPRCAGRRLHSRRRTSCRRSGRRRTTGA